MASEAEDDSEAAAEEPPALSDSGLEESATEFEWPIEHTVFSVCRL